MKARSSTAAGQIIKILPRCWCHLVLLAAIGALAPSVSWAEPPPAAASTTAAPKSPWDGMVMIGASVSAGFTVAEPLGGPQTQQLRLSRHLEAALIAPHAPIRNFGSALFFLQPGQAGPRQIELAVAAQPSFVFAVDFLFWYSYGNLASDEARLAAFDQGLKMLEAFSCPVVVGDIPDASAAAGGVISASQIPSAAVLAECNRRLRAWAARRPNVIVVPLSTFMQAVMANAALSVRGHTWAKGETRALLQPDNLHPNAAGTAALAILVWDAVQMARPTFSVTQLRWDPAEVLRRSRAEADSGAPPAAEPQ